MLSQLIIGVILPICLFHIRGISSLKCYKCMGTACQMEEKLNDTTECGPSDYCVSIMDHRAILYRGCYSSIPSTLENICSPLSFAECDVCSKDLCNNKGPSKCVECNVGNQIHLCYVQFSDKSHVRCPLLTSLRPRCFLFQKEERSMDSINITRACLTHWKPQCPAIMTNPRPGCNDIFALFSSYTYKYKSSGPSGPNGRHNYQVMLIVFISIYFTF